VHNIYILLSTHSSKNCLQVEYYVLFEKVPISGANQLHNFIS